MTSRMGALGVRGITIALTAIALSGCGDGPTEAPPAGSIDLALPWTETSPDELGIDGGALDAAGDDAATIDRMRSLLVARKGRLVYERYYGGWTSDTLADVRSVTKTVVSTLVGIAVQNGDITSLDQPITDFLTSPEFPVRPIHGAITIRHLLTMTAGIEWDETGVEMYNDWILSTDQVAYVLALDFEADPGAAFVYNSAAVHLLGVILEKATGMELEAYADQVLFGPLGITRREWEPVSGGYVNATSGLDLRPRDLARYGQLLLQQGWSGDRWIVPKAWVDEATIRHFRWTVPSPPIEHLSYGFLCWVDIDHGGYIAWGYAGQFIYVVPARHLVVVATTDWRGVSTDVGAQALATMALGIIVDGVLPAVH